MTNSLVERLYCLSRNVIYETQTRHECVFPQGMDLYFYVLVGIVVLLLIYITSFLLMFTCTRFWSLRNMLKNKKRSRVHANPF